MADGVMFTNAADQIKSNYEKYKDMYASEEETTLGLMDFMNLMIAQLQNQDFNNPQSDTEFIAQMAQFSALEAQQENLNYAQGNYANGLIGKTVYLGTSTTEDGISVSDTGVVTGVYKQGDEYKVSVNGQYHSLSSVVSVIDSNIEVSVDGGNGETSEEPEKEETIDDFVNEEDSVIEEA